MVTVRRVVDQVQGGGPGALELLGDPDSQRALGLLPAVLQNVGITITSTEKELTDQIKELAVKTPNRILSLCDFMNMCQREGEDMCQYSARLKGAADLCDFTVPEGETSYADQMVLGRLVAGHRDKEIARRSQPSRASRQAGWS